MNKNKKCVNARLSQAPWLKQITKLGLLLLLLMGMSMSVDAGLAVVSVTDRPGYFRLDKSTNDKVCSSLSQIINGDIKKYGETRFYTHSEFAKWRKVEESRIDRGEVHKYDGMVEQADVDINNDGVVDQVIRTQWSIRGVFEDALNIFPEHEQTITIVELIKPDKMISFNAGNYWLERYKKKYVRRGQALHLTQGSMW